MLFLASIIIPITASLVFSHDAPLKLFDLTAGAMLTLEQTRARLQSYRIIVVGEHHATPEHHRVQLQVIDLLQRAHVPLAIGMEMFRRDSQKALDRWTAGSMEEQEFEKVFLDNWGFSWPAYRPLLVYARSHRIPVIGLNVPRAVTSQVARKGFASLSPEQRGLLPGVTCDVSPEYMAFIREAYGAHTHGDMDFVRFCEAQLVWDTAMAVHALEYVNNQPRRTLVILAGSGHAHKMGIPSQIEKLSRHSHTVILPEAPGISLETITPADADFVAVGLNKDGPSR